MSNKPDRAQGPEQVGFALCPGISTLDGWFRRAVDGAWGALFRLEENLEGLPNVQIRLVVAQRIDALVQELIAARFRLLHGPPAEAEQDTVDL